MPEPSLDGVPILEGAPAHALSLAGPDPAGTRSRPPADRPDTVAGPVAAPHPGEAAVSPFPVTGSPQVTWTSTGGSLEPDSWFAPSATIADGRPAEVAAPSPVPSPAPSLRPASTSSPAPAVDWEVVRAVRQRAAQELAERLRSGHESEESRLRHGREIVVGLVADHARAQAAGGLRMLDGADEARLVSAVMDALFGLGRLQPLVDDDDIENIEITGHDQVRLLLRDGAIRHGEPVAESDEELIDFLQFIASRGSASGAERPFSQSNPRLHLSLPGRGRLAATAWVTARPVVRIRRQTIKDVTLADLCALGSIGYPLQRFLEALMSARMNLVVSGEPGVGKTTFVRALAAAIPPSESLATLESEWELYLDRLPSRQLRPVEAFEARPGAGELGPDGRRSGAITLEELFEDVLRHNVDRIIVGEVRGSEALAMFRAMQAGRGSLSTIHAKNARDTAQRLVTCITGSGAAADYAWGLVATNIDVIVHLRAEVDRHSGRRLRYVSEVVEVRPGDGPGSGTRPAFTTLFSRARGERLAQPHTPPTPELLEELADAGFDSSLLDPGRAFAGHGGLR